MPDLPESTASVRTLADWALGSEDYALVILSAEAKVTWANGALRRVLGYEPDELVGRTLECIFTQEDLERGLADHELAVARAVGRAEDDRWHVGKSGVRVYCHGVLMTMRGPAGEPGGFVKVFRDRTDVRTRMEALENRLREAQRDAGRKDGFISTLAHELRGPLHAASNAAVLMRRSTDQAQIAKALAIVERQAATMARLVDDLLEATRLDVGQVQLRMGAVVVQDAIAAAAESIAERAAARRIAVHVVVPEVPIGFEADDERIGQILRNLLENAIKYTPPGGNVWVTATVEVEVVAIRVQDDGDGMSADVLPRVFEMFTREARAMDAATDGLGIGLAVVKNLVQLHHGVIEVQSAGVGRGSEFTLILPLRQPAA